MVYMCLLVIVVTVFALRVVSLVYGIVVFVLLIVGCR